MFVYADFICLANVEMDSFVQIFQLEGDIMSLRLAVTRQSYEFTTVWLYISKGI